MEYVLEFRHSYFSNKYHMSMHSFVFIYDMMTFELNPVLGVDHIVHLFV